MTSLGVYCGRVKTAIWLPGSFCFETYLNVVDTRMCPQVAGLLEHTCACSFQDLGFWINAALRAWSLFHCVPLPPHLTQFSSSEPWKSRVPWRREQVCSSEPAREIFTGGKSSTRGWEGELNQKLRRNPFWMSYALALLFGETHSLSLPYSLAPKNPG